MLFHSWQYLLFLPVVIGLFNLLPLKLRPYLLLLASYGFYASWNVAYLSLIVLSTSIDYFCALGMESGKKKYRKLFLILSLSSNLGLLFSFKYLNYAFSLLGWDNSTWLPAWILPVGISFYTFQTLSYSIDVYKQRLTAERNFFHFALFVSFFPQLVAGPIERASSLLPQLKNPQRSSLSDIHQGLALFLWGLMKKVVVADRMAVITDRFFHPSYQPDSLEALIGMIFFGLQILFDFSAYTDMARGSAKCLGIHLMENFLHPYGSKSFREFWQRWHISLSTWFRDYVYIPLGGNKINRQRTFLNLLITFGISGLWHGAASTFVVWGIIHGTLLILEKIAEEYKSFRLHAFNFLITFAGVHLAWVWFRAENTAHALNYIQTLFSFNFQHSIQPLLKAENAWIKEIITYSLALITALFVLHLEKIKIRHTETDFLKRLKNPLWMACVLLMVLFFGLWGSSSFIYFQF